MAQLRAFALGSRTIAATVNATTGEFLICTLDVKGAVPLFTFACTHNAAIHRPTGPPVSRYQWSVYDAENSRAAGDVHLLTLDDMINPISGRYLERGIEEAEEQGAAAVLVELSTPGGLLEATQDLTSAMLSARVPVIVYVTPPGTHAASAGVFITMARKQAGLSISNWATCTSFVRSS